METILLSSLGAVMILALLVDYFVKCFKVGYYEQTLRLRAHQFEPERYKQIEDVMSRWASVLWM